MILTYKYVLSVGHAYLCHSLAKILDPRLVSIMLINWKTNPHQRNKKPFYIQICLVKVKKSYLCAISNLFQEIENCLNLAAAPYTY